MKLSKNFTLEEFTRSDTAVKLGIKNDPSPEHILRIRRLALMLLQPLRNLYGKPIRISSGYRCAELNKAVGGVETSQHTKGEAADASVDDPRRLLNILLKSGLEFDQAILYPTFLHLSLKADGNRKQVLASKGVTL